MSECVVRMEKPKSCDDCDIAQRFGTEIYCPFFGWYADYDKCPIFLHLPEGHGRLVDADALKEWFIEQIDYYKRFDGPNCSMMVSAYEAVCRVINDAPTIVPEERSKA